MAFAIDPRGIPLTGVPYKADLYTTDLELGDFTRRASGEIQGPVFFPRDLRIAFGSGHDSEWSINFGDATYDVILNQKDYRYPFKPSSFSADGSRLAYDQNGNIYVMPLEGDRKPQVFLSTRYEQRNPVFSPNGHWISYDLSDGRGGRTDIWVRPYPGPEPAVRVSTEGGSHSRWSLDGTRIYFLNEAGKIMSADVTPGNTFRTSVPKVFMENVQGIRSFLISRDGTFYAIVNDTPNAPTKRDITVVTGWFDEVRELAGVTPRK